MKVREDRLLPAWHWLCHGLFSDFPGLFSFVRSHLPLRMNMRIVEGKLDDRENKQTKKNVMTKILLSKGREHR